MRIYDDDALAVKAWNLMGGLDWAAVPLVCELLGITDVEGFVHRWAAVRNFHNRDRNE